MNVPAAHPVRLTIDGREREFDIDDPVLPRWVEEGAFSSADYPYEDKYDRDAYEDELRILQEELVHLQYWLLDRGQRIIAVFEGRDAAGKGGAIKRLTAYLNPRHVHLAALPKPSDREQGQWYYQRYIPWFPSEGEMTVFDRSWYNRAGVEPVMGFCTEDQYRHFLQETPRFEDSICRENIHFFKFWLNIGQEMQLKRFHDRRHDPLKIWKLSPIDLRALEKWDEYTEARDRMMRLTHSHLAPWTVIMANDKRRARLNVLRHLLGSLEYDGKNASRIPACDKKICGGPELIGIR